ncbi:hypothetical protein CR513_62032, partial [Mucuna pruriens]
MAQFLDVAAALHSMFMVLKSGQFIDSLCTNSPTTMEELRMRATIYIQMEEMAEFRDSVLLGTTQHQETQTFWLKQWGKGTKRGADSRTKISAYNANKTKYYRYQRNYGHITEGFLTFGDMIEELIQLIPTTQHENKANTLLGGNERQEGTQPLSVIGHLGGNRHPNAKAPRDSEQENGTCTINNVHIALDRVARQLPPNHLHRPRLGRI